MSKGRRATLVERWENVLRVLNGLTPHERRKHFDMSIIAQRQACGTVGCAVGFCGLDQWFIRRGIKTKVELPHIGQPVPDALLERAAYEKYWDEHGVGDVSYKDDQEVDAFFGSGTEKIFWNGNPRPHSKVIKEVRAHIRWLKTTDESVDSL